MARTSINVPITGDAAPLRRELRGADDALGNFESGGGRKLANIGRAFAAAFAVDVIVDFGREMFDLGRKLEAINVKVDTVFGDQAEAIRAWADANNEALGLTDTELSGLAASFADLLKPMGFTTDQAAEMTQQSLDLAGALSAWSLGQRSVSEVSDILVSAMLGEFDSLKSLGISIDAAEVQTRALALAQADGRDEVTAMDEALATQMLILEKSTDAQAAWADGSLDNIKTQNELQAKLAEVREEIAQKLYPAFVAVGEWLVNSFIPWVEGDLVPALQQAWDKFEQFIPTLTFMWAIIRDQLVPAFITLHKLLFTGLATAFRLLGRVISEEVWPVLMFVGKTFVGVFEAARVVIQKVIDAVKKLWDGLKRVVDPLQKVAGFVGGGVSVNGPFGLPIGIDLPGIPGLASGGVVTGPTLAMIGEAGPEAVVPLDRMGSMGGSPTINNYFPAGTSGEDVVQALERWVRANGKLPKTLVA